MELSFNELKKRDVINVADGRCLGRINNLTLSFPKGILVGVTVPGSKKNCIMQLFDRNKIFIDESKILKIGNDVILVDMKCGDVCEPNVVVNKRPPSPPSPICPSCSDLFKDDKNNRIDTDDY